MAGHLGTNLVVVLGHEHCGAVGAAIHDEPQGYIKYITDEIRRAIGEEKDGLKVCGALYRIDTGLVEFLD